MKKHAIIPIFIPHKGCPNDCVFCNQKKITARTADVTPEDARRTIEQYLMTLEGRGLDVIEVAFFGGSFTGIPLEEQSAFLAVADEYKQSGRIKKIHLSTRPDYINREILDNLKRHHTDIIELGVQSFDDEVLKKCKRGHTAKDVEQAARLIHEYGFTLGLQLMIGLPGDSKETCIESAKRAVELKPALARLYPTVVINETELADMYRAGTYTALSTAEAVDITKDMYRILTEAGVQVIRVGLKNTDLINDGGPESQVLADFHPSFRQLMDSAIAREDIERGMIEIGSNAKAVELVASPLSFDALSGYRGSNREWFTRRFPGVKFTFVMDDSVPADTYIVCEIK